jgi:ParB family chromosome partitioning protein
MVLIHSSTPCRKKLFSCSDQAVKYNSYSMRRATIFLSSGGAAMTNPKKRLGRGLEALLSAPSGGEAQVNAGNLSQQPSGGVPAQATEALPTRLAAEDAAVARTSDALGAPAELPLDRISPNPQQPRKDFTPAALEDLMKSITANGIIQPVVVRRHGPSRFELISGERRLRAAQALGLASIPAVIRDVPDERLLELALIENIQREDLNPIEKAEAFRDFLGRYGVTQEEAAKRVGVDRASLANLLRLLDLPDEIQTLVRRGALSMSHARTIAGVPDRALQLALAKKTIRQSLSVRQLERMAAKLGAGASRSKAIPTKTVQVAALEDEIRRSLGTKVRIEEGARRGSGRIVIEYYSLDDFDRILGVIRR